MAWSPHLDEVQADLTKNTRLSCSGLKRAVTAWAKPGGKPGESRLGSEDTVLCIWIIVPSIKLPKRECWHRGRGRWMRQGRTTCLGGTMVTMWPARGAEGSLGCNVGTAELWSSFGSVAGRKRVWLTLLPRKPVGEENVAAMFVTPMLPIYLASLCPCLWDWVLESKGLPWEMSSPAVELGAVTLERMATHGVHPHQSQNCQSVMPHLRNWAALGFTGGSAEPSVPHCYEWCRPRGFVQDIYLCRRIPSATLRSPVAKDLLNCNWWKM